MQQIYRNAFIVCIFIMILFTGGCYDGTVPSATTTTAQVTAVLTPPPSLSPQPSPQQTSEPSGTPTAYPETPSPTTPTSSGIDYDSREYFMEIDEIKRKELVFLFGEDIINENPKTIVARYGDPIEKHAPDNEPWQDANRIGYWKFAQGFWINVSTENDAPIIQNYIYLSPTCEFKLSSDIKIGSTREDIYTAYGELINPKFTTDNRVSLDEEILFVLSDDTVQSIYIGMWGYDSNRWYFFGEI